MTEVTINYQPIFDRLDTMKSELKHELKQELVEELREEFNPQFSQIRTAVANLAGQLKDFRDEFIISTYRLDRLEGWAGEAGQRIDLPFTR